MWFRFGKFAFAAETKPPATLTASETKYLSTKPGEATASFSKYKSDADFLRPIVIQTSTVNSSSLECFANILYLNNIPGNYKLHFQVTKYNEVSYIVRQISWFTLQAPVWWYSLTLPSYSHLPI